MTSTEPRSASLPDRLLAWPQWALPHHALSRIVFRLTRLEAGPLVTFAIRLFVRLFRVNLAEAAEPEPGAYPSFNAFFTRALAPGARPGAGGPGEVACPVDGTVSQAGEIHGDSIFQAKGRDFSLYELLGGEAAAGWPERFQGGSFATLYLSPRDYHRIHMPTTGRLRRMVHVPGRLFSVNPGTTRVVPRLFARNERVVACFDTEDAGPLALVLVGALFVSAIETMWAGLVTPPAGRAVVPVTYGEEGQGKGEPAPITLARGEEMGRFNMGSTVIVLFGPGRVEWAAEIRPGAAVRMGQLLGRLG
jgi:phosphatidylserine decarboxylase